MLVWTSDAFKQTLLHSQHLMRYLKSADEGLEEDDIEKSIVFFCNTVNQKQNIELGDKMFLGFFYMFILKKNHPIIW